MAFVFICPFCQKSSEEQEETIGQIQICSSCHNFTVIQKGTPAPVIPEDMEEEDEEIEDEEAEDEESEDEEAEDEESEDEEAEDEEAEDEEAEDEEAEDEEAEDEEAEDEEAEDEEADSRKSSEPPKLRPVNPETSSGPLKLYSPRAIGWWSLLFSALFGSWCVYANYAALGNKKAASRSNYWSCAILVLLFFIPIGGIGIWIIWYFAELRRQIKYLKEKNIHYQKKSWAMPLIFAVSIILLLAGIRIGLAKIFQ